MSEIAPGTLFVCATPIGNLGDVSSRLAQTLGSVDVIYAEDTRRTGKLLEHLAISTKLRSLFAGNEVARTADLVADIASGLAVALVSDAGTPAISDPGALAVAEVRKVGGVVTVIPGPSAATMAIAASGFGGERFAFEGFLPRKGRDRKARLEAIATEERNVVLFASPHRIVADLEALAEASGPGREIVVCRELTKLHEEIWSGTLGEAVTEWSLRDPKGEFTVVLAGAEEQVPDYSQGLGRAKALVDSGATLSDAARQVAVETGLPRRQIYQELLKRQELS